MVKLNRSTRTSVKASSDTFIGEDLWLEFLPRHLLDLHIVRKSKRSIRAMKYIPMCTSFLFLVRVSLSQFLLQWRATSANSSSASLSFWTLCLILSAIYHFQRGLLDSRILIPVTQWSIRRSHCLGLAHCLLMMLLNWAICQMRSLTWLSIRCVVKPPLSCQIPWFLLPIGWLQHGHSRPRCGLVTSASGLY